MSEMQPNTPFSSADIPTAESLYLLGVKLERALAEQQTDGKVDLTQAALRDRYETADVDLKKIEEDIAAKQAEKIEIEKEIADVVEKMGNEEVMISGLSPAAEEISGVREAVLLGRIRNCNQKKRLLTNEIKELEIRRVACVKYIAENRQYHQELLKRQGSIDEALGYLAIAMARMDSLAEVQPVPPLFTDMYKYAPVIADRSLDNFVNIGIAPSERSTTISIPVNVPMQIESPPAQEEVLRKPPLPVVPISQQSAKKFLRKNNQTSNR